MCGPPATTVGYLDPGQINKVTIDGYVHHIMLYFSLVLLATYIHNVAHTH